MKIPRWVSVGLALVGVMVIAIAVTALLYAFAPISHHLEQVPVAPTLFVPPPG
jgi:hypothetical protein